MISLLYHSHTVVPGHLAELEALGLIESDEQILVALDGVLLDGNGRRLSGPTLHDYCVVTNLRVILWARDYGRHICCAFPLAELTTVEGAGVDPIHAQIQLFFSAPDEDDQHFTLALFPVASLQAALTLLRTASEAARELADEGVDSREAGGEIMAVLSEQIYGHVDGLRPGETPYRWPGGSSINQPVTPGPAFVLDPASLPPGQFYTAGRLARSAWDTLRRSIREADLPIELNSGSLRELTEAVRAINDLVHTVATNPSAQQMAMAFINNRNNNAQGPAPAAEAPRRGAQYRSTAAAPAPAEAASPSVPPTPAVYHEIPLRRRGATPQQQGTLDPPTEKPVEATQRSSADDRAEAPVPDRREIPLRRRGQTTTAPRPIAHGHLPAVSGSGDAGLDERPSTTDDHHR